MATLDKLTDEDILDYESNELRILDLYKLMDLLK